MPLTEPGPKSVTEGSTYVASRPNASFWDTREFLIQLHAAHKDRINVVTRVADGQWYVVWPDLTHTPEAPTIANLVEMGINHWSSLGGAMLPTVRASVDPTGDVSQGKRGARKRERRVRELWDLSRISELSALLWGDYAGCGSALVGVWTDFSLPPAERDPYLMRFDPRHTYTLRDNLGRVSELMVARVLTRKELGASWPEHRALFEKSPDQSVEEIFWFYPDRFLHMIMDTSKDGKKSGRGVVLVDEENKLGFVPAVEIVRPSFDGQRRGVFDQTIHILRTMHRLMTLTIYSTEEQVFSPILEFDTMNAEKFGPGQIIHARSAEGKVQRLAPTNHFDVKDLIRQLGDEARNQASWPQQLGGEPGASITSARGIKASMGALDARLALAHKQFEVGFGVVSGMLLAMDEIYCYGKKLISGDVHDKQQGEEYDPARDVNGNWKIVCTYGVGAGSDPQSKEMRLHMHLGGRLLSRTTARDQLDFLDDSNVEELNMAREMLRDAFLAGLAQQTVQGQLNLTAETWKLMQHDDADIDEILEKIADQILAPPPAADPMAGPGGGDPAAQALQQAESLARGGIPGNAEQGPPGMGGGESFGLPPLGDIMNQSSLQSM